MKPANGQPTGERRQRAKTARFWLLTAAIVAASAAASGCAPMYYDAPFYDTHDGVDQAPPEPKYEHPSEPPAPDVMWVPGYWYWGGTTYLWVGGRWAAPPAAGHIYVRSGWVVRDGRHHYVRGYWAPPRTRVRYQYIHPGPKQYRQRVRAR